MSDSCPMFDGTFASASRQSRLKQREVQFYPLMVVRTADGIIGLAQRYGRYGYRRITALLRAEGWRCNHKRVERIWRAEG